MQEKGNQKQMCNLSRVSIWTIEKGWLINVYSSIIVMNLLKTMWIKPKVYCIQGKLIKLSEKKRAIAAAEVVRQWIRM